MVCWQHANKNFGVHYASSFILWRVHASQLMCWVGIYRVHITSITLPACTHLTKLPPVSRRDESCASSICYWFCLVAPVGTPSKMYRISSNSLNLMKMYVCVYRGWFCRGTKAIFAAAWNLLRKFPTNWKYHATSRMRASSDLHISFPTFKKANLTTFLENTSENGNMFWRTSCK